MSREFRIEINGNEEVMDIETVVIYNDGSKLAEIPSRYLAEIGDIVKNRYGNEQFYHNDYDKVLKGFALQSEIKRALKENLNRKDNFYMSHKNRYGEKEITLYINESEVILEDLGVILSNEFDGEKNYQQAYRLEFPSSYIRYGYSEKIICGKDWKIPDNGKWGNYYGTKECPCYDSFDHKAIPEINVEAESGVMKRWMEYIWEQKPITIVSGCYCKTEYSGDKATAHELEKIAEENGLKYSSYDFEKLLKLFDIKPKEASK